MSDFMTLLQNRQTCRAFSTTPVEQEKMDILRQAIMLSPSKNNEYDCDVRILGPNATEEKHGLYLASKCDPDNPDIPIFYNPQVLAPVVFVFMAPNRALRDLWGQNQYKRAYRNAYMQSALSAICVVFAAEDIGLSTGFCGALNQWLDQDTTPGITDYNDRICFALGIGYARDDVNSKRDRVRPDQSHFLARGAGPETKPEYSSWVTEVGF